jgi:DNA repair protein RadC
MLRKESRMNQLRERLQQYGVQSLSTEELLTLALCTSPANDSILARIEPLLSSYGGLRGLVRADFGDLCYDYRLGPVRTAQLQALLEIARRLAIPAGEQKYQITCPADAAALVMAEMTHLDHEQMRVLALDTKSQVVVNQVLAQGTIDSADIRVAEAFRPAITRKCARVIFCHNHPSGSLEASPEDVQVTRRLVKAGELLEIGVLDHLIIADQRFLSLRDQMRWAC